MTEALTISPTRPADISMDYERLRAEGIEHLEELASQIWTDFNAHDPGITILEVLCYALTDLGYRANLPIADLLTTGGSGQGGSVFFSPTEVLPNCPYTRKDYRKLFIDVAGVKNAWVYKYYPTAEERTRYPIENNTEYTTPVPLNGLYHILLELQDGLSAESKVTKAIVERVRARYYDNRNLGEDIQRISIVRDCPFCLCVDLELETDGIPTDILAEAMFTIQEYLAPHPQFYSFQQLLDQGTECEHILDGPLLENGFLPDSELERSPLRQVIYRSDLIRVLMETEGVKAVKSLTWKKADEHVEAGFNADWCLEFHNCPTRPAAAECEIFYQPYLDLCCSNIWTTRGVMTRKYTEADLQDALGLLTLERDMPVDRSLPHLATGKYRPDLSDYGSVQFEFPENYTIGAYDPPASADSLRRAQQHQLQAFLTFFDQILAAYLKQLAGVRDLLSVNQDPTAPTYFAEALCEVPGMRDLVADFAVYDLAESKVVTWINENSPSASLADKLLALPANFPRRFQSTAVFEEQLQNYLGTSLWRDHSTTLKSAFYAVPTQEDWSVFCTGGTGEYFDQLANLTETNTQRELRRNRIMDHLLARFGEHFTEYSLQLFATQVARENDPNTVNFDEYLGDKATFLKELPVLGSQRGKGYNYRAKNSQTEAKSVWNVDNVAGLKKRVALLLGLEDYAAASLLCDPAYILRINQQDNRSGTGKTYQLQFKNRENGQVLLESRVFSRRSRKKIASEWLNALRPHLHKVDYYRMLNENNVWQVVFDPSGDDDYALETEGPPLYGPEFTSRQQADQWLTGIIELVESSDCEREGFHLLEHILLRPNDPDDMLLQLDCTDCFPFDPIDSDQYSFIVSVFLPNWPQRFQNENYQRFVEQTFRREVPAHIYLRFCWLDRDAMQFFEGYYKNWREAMVNCGPDRECSINEHANRLIVWLNSHNCTCPPVLENDKGKCIPTSSVSQGTLS